MINEELIENNKGNIEGENAVEEAPEIRTEVGKDEISPEIVKQQGEKLASSLAQYRDVVYSKEWQASLRQGGEERPDLKEQIDFIKIEINTYANELMKMLDIDEASVGAFKEAGVPLEFLKGDLTKDSMLKSVMSEFDEQGGQKTGRVERTKSANKSRIPKIGESGIYKTPRGNVEGKIVKGNPGGPFEIETNNGKIIVDKIF